MSECQTPGLMGEISGGSLKLDLLLWPSMPDIEKKHLNYSQLQPKKHFSHRLREKNLSIRAKILRIIRTS